MILNKFSVCGSVLAAVLAGISIVGCGGGSSSVSGAQGSIKTTGGLTTTTQTFTTGVGSSTSPQQVQVTVNGTNQNATLPPGETITSGQSVAVVPPTTIINGLAGPATRGAHAAPQAGTPGEVDVDGKNTGLTVTSGGALSGYLILTPGNHVITAYGAFNIVGGTAFSPTTLTIAKFVFGVIVNADGTSTIPGALTLNLPINGGTLKNGHVVTAGYPAVFATHTGTLILSYSGVIVSKTQPLVVNSSTGFATATYNALSNHPNLPSTGLDSVEFDVK